jgi:hypothetical protein
LLLLVLLVVAVQQWIDRESSTSWDRPLWIGIYPMNGDGSEAAERYVRSLESRAFAGIERFFEAEGERYDIPVTQPVHIELYPVSEKPPPVLPPQPGPLDAIWWSLKLRWYASHAADVPGRASPHIRVFVLFHDPDTTLSVPHSLGLQKGLIGVVYAYASRGAEGPNNVVIAHEVMHTLGATDKYDRETNAPLFPIGYGDPDRKPLFPQPLAEIMAGRRALSREEFDMPSSLREVTVGPLTAAEIRWIRPK